MFLVSAGIVLAINLVNYHNIDASARAALEMTRDNPGRRFAMMSRGEGEPLP